MELTGKIIKGIAGFYYVHTEAEEIVECKAKGVFRNRGQKPLVGDDVRLAAGRDETGAGVIAELLPRKNELLRPAVANVDQVMIVFAMTDPEPHFNLLDRLLLSVRRQNVPVLLGFSKTDLVTAGACESVRDIYRDCGAPCVFFQTESERDVAAIRERLQGKTTVLAGPSGVGKTTLLNRICPDAQMATGALSEKIRRGKHTTRHSELFYAGDDTYLCDTPGFGSLYLPEMEKEELALWYEEFAPYRDACRYVGCSHMQEPDCKVKEAVAKGFICMARYESYQTFYKEISSRKKY